MAFFWTRPPSLCENKGERKVSTRTFRLIAKGSADLHLALPVAE
jgi:hypothetical protein